MAFPQGLGAVEYTLNVLLKGKKKFGSAKKWTSTLLLKVEISRRAIGARLETMAIADSPLGKTKHNIMVSPTQSLTDNSWNIHIFYSPDIRIIILHYTFLRDYYKCTLSKLHLFRNPFTKLLVGIIVVLVWLASFVVWDKRNPTSANKAWNESMWKFKKWEMKD
jgi:hypothetical protein